MEKKLKIKDNYNGNIDFEQHTKEIIEENWDFIKDQIIQLNNNVEINKICLNVEKTGYQATLIKIKQDEETINKLVISKDEKKYACQNIYKESRMITFTHFLGDKSETKINLVCSPKDIGFYLKK